MLLLKVCCKITITLFYAELGYNPKDIPNKYQLVEKVFFSARDAPTPTTLPPEWGVG